MGRSSKSSDRSHKSKRSKSQHQSRKSKKSSKQKILGFQEIKKSGSHQQSEQWESVKKIDLSRSQSQTKFHRERCSSSSSDDSSVSTSSCQQRKSRRRKKSLPSTSRSSSSASSSDERYDHKQSLPNHKRSKKSRTNSKKRGPLNVRKKQCRTHSASSSSSRQRDRSYRSVSSNSSELSDTRQRFVVVRSSQSTADGRHISNSSRSGKTKRDLSVSSKSPELCNKRRYSVRPDSPGPSRSFSRSSSSSSEPSNKRRFVSLSSSRPSKNRGHPTSSERSSEDYEDRQYSRHSSETRHHSAGSRSPRPCNNRQRFSYSSSSEQCNKRYDNRLLCAKSSAPQPSTQERRLTLSPEECQKSQSKHNSSSVSRKGKLESQRYRSENSSVDSVFSKTRRDSSPTSASTNSTSRRGITLSRSSTDVGSVSSDRGLLSPRFDVPECQCEEDLGVVWPDRERESRNDHCPPPILDLRLKLNMSRSQSSVSLGFSTPRSGFETQHGSVRAHKTPRNHRDLSADSRNRSDPSRPEQKRDSTLKRQDAYHTPRRSTFASLLSSNNQTPRTPKEYLAPKALTFSPSNEVWAAEFIARSESYRYSFIDSHCHLDFMYNRMGVPFQTEYSDFMEDHKDSYPDNYEGCVAVFCNPRTFHMHRPQDQILKIVSEEIGVWLALGCHPKSATEFGNVHEQGLRKMLSHPKVVALGEIGLDYSGRFSQNADVQKRVLIIQLKMAIELDLPLVIHCRDADDDCLDIMTQHVPEHYKIHLHCFTRDPYTAQRWMDAFPNLYLGFTPVITYKSAWEPSLAAKNIPLDRLLLETDAPYFVPGHIKNSSVKLSHPGFALFTAEKIAELRGIPVDDVLKACRENTRSMYGI